MNESLESVKADKPEHRLVRVVGSLLTALCLVWLGWMARTLIPQRIIDPAQAAAAMTEDVSGKDQAPPTVVGEVTNALINPALEYLGRVEPMQDVEVRAQIDGYLLKLHFTEGAMVREGDLLFSIDPERYEARVQVRKAEIGVAEAALDRAERLLKRLESSDSRAITQMDLDTARSDVAQGHAAVKQARANLLLAEIDLKHTRIVAPISGQIGRSQAFAGDYVAPSLGSLARIVQVDPIRVAFSVTDKDLLRIREKNQKGASDHMRIRLRLPTGAMAEMEGERDFEDNLMSIDTATLSVRARFDNRHGMLVPDGYVTVLVDQANPIARSAVPQEAILSDQDGDFVYVVDRNDIAQLRRITIGAFDNGMYAVLSGLENGERIVVKGVQKVEPGQAVRMVAGEVEETSR